jgi:UDP-2-acetamido-2,6-beta-L-arabino-hexul-4-ose reductase
MTERKWGLILKSGFKIEIMKIGITGQKGFVGSILYDFLNLQEDVSLVEFEKSFFLSELKLQQFVAECDVIVHLAAMNRHEDETVIYKTNIDLVEKIVSACQMTKSTPHILISSSTQEDKDNLYGKSKKEGRVLLEKWAINNGGSVTGLIIPNVFGPFGKPNYNSVVATFCHKVAHGETPEIHVDGEVDLIYVLDLVEEILQLIRTKNTADRITKVTINGRRKIKVSSLLALILGFKHLYLDHDSFPNLEDEFEKALFNTFRCYVPATYYPKLFTQHTDDRGSFVEIARTHTSGQSSFSTTVPGITRGNHYHTRKAERFAVIKGKAKIELRKINTDEVIEYFLDGDKPSYVDMPIWYTHNITNIGDEELYTIFWINEPYDAADADTYFENV